MFQVITVDDDAAEQSEVMGTKPKFWFTNADGKRSLFKESRPETGEDWAEKVSAELADMLGLPHARIELAIWHGRRGTVTPTFVPEHGMLIHGNEILARMQERYPEPSEGSKAFYRVSQHTVDAVFRSLADLEIELPMHWTPPPNVATAEDVFVGYLMLDAWIGNQDRHHENWGWILNLEVDEGPTVTFHLAPTYDHAASLGRNETDEIRAKRLATSDRRFSVEAYVEKARSAMYAKEGDPTPLTTFDAFCAAGRRSPAGSDSWLNRLSAISTTDTLALLRQVPQDRISEPAIRFSSRMLEINGNRLLRFRDELP